MRKLMVLFSLVALFVIQMPIAAENFTKNDASYLKDLISEDDEFEEDDSRKIVKYLEQKYELLLKNESNKKVALEIMQHIEDAMSKSKKELKEENWDSAATWAIVGISWIQALDVRHAMLAKESYYNQVKKSK